MAKAHILIVDDEADIRLMLEGALKDEGYDVKSVADIEKAAQAFQDKLPDLVLLDIWIHGSMDGLDFLTKLRRDYPSVPVIMISGHGNIETAVQAIKRGAYDFLEKPFKMDRLYIFVKRALEARKLQREVDEMRRQVDKDVNFMFKGSSEAIQKAMQDMQKISGEDGRVMILGEAGTGKKAAALWIHRHSSRAKENFVVMNCANILPSHQIEELFGCEAANAAPKIGVIERAHGGTLVLHDIQHMPQDLQAKLLRFMQEGVFERLGTRRSIRANTRMIATSAIDLKSMAENGLFLKELYQKLATSTLIMPSLRARLDDLQPLSDALIKDLALTTSLTVRRLDVRTQDQMREYSWPGNIRQLRNVLESMLMASSQRPRHEGLMPDVLPMAVSGSTEGGEMAHSNSPTSVPNVNQILSLPLKEARDVFERDYLFNQISRFGGNISKTATFVGMDRTALHRKLKQLRTINRPRLLPDQDNQGPKPTGTEAV